MIDKLAWGLPNEVPDDATSAWGARIIMDPAGNLDFVPDRMERQGSAAIFDVLGEEFTPDHLTAKVKELLGSGEMSPREGNLCTLYKSDTLTVVGNTNGSYGYLYVAAWTTKEGA